MRKLILIATLAVVVAFGSEALAQGVGVSLDVETISSKRILQPGATTANLGPTQVFSAKFLCGTIKPSIDSAGNIINPQLGNPLVPGTYLTAINIHNPNPYPVQFWKKAVETKSQLEKERGRIGGLVLEELKPDQGLEVDCRDVTEVLLPPPPNTGFDPAKDFLKGFVVIITRDKDQLDVVGVYTLKNVELRMPQ